MRCSPSSSSASTGTVRQRPEGTVNPQLSTGEVELGDCTVEMLATSETPPFNLDERTETDEAVRLRYRYLDLRSERMQKNLRTRATVNSAIRRAMERQGFVEIETPLLWTPTPEGAREFAVPSRLQHGNFYVLPQSPQIAKQLTMIGGFDRYYQIARCVRDEDLRADRQFEFTQLDVEACFVDEREIRGFVSEAMVEATEAVTGERPAPFEELTWGEAIDRYGTDKPDLRFGIEIVDLTAAFSSDRVQGLPGAEAVKAIVLPGGAELGRARLDALVERAKTLRRARVSSGCGSSVTPASTRVADRQVPLRRRAGGCRRRWPRGFPVTWCWSSPTNTAAPARCSASFARSSDDRRSARARSASPGWSTSRCSTGSTMQGHPAAAHHPFTMPYLEDLELIETDPLSVRAQSYDLVLNGWELGSGSIRINEPALQRRVFEVLGISPELAEARFGFLLEAYRYGAPPHGGFAVWHRSPRRHPRRRGEHPRGDRLPEDPVGRRPDDRGSAAAARGASSASSASRS